MNSELLETLYLKLWPKQLWFGHLEWWHSCVLCIPCLDNEECPPLLSSRSDVVLQEDRSRQSGCITCYGEKLVPIVWHLPEAVRKTVQLQCWSYSKSWFACMQLSLWTNDHIELSWSSCFFFFNHYLPLNHSYEAWNSCNEVLQVH